MNRAEVEALMFRWKALYPLAWHGDAVEASVRLEEWMATPAIVECGMDAAAAAFDEWKVTNDRPPTLHQFVDLVARLRNRRRREELEAAQLELLAEYDETIVPPEEAKKHIDAIREQIASIRRRDRAVLGG